MRATDNLWLICARADKRLTKRWLASGEIEDYDDKLKWFTVRSERIAGIRELSALLTRIESKSNECIIRGAFVGGPRAVELLNALTEDDRAGRRENEAPRRNDFFEDQPLHTVCFDVDDFEPFGADPVVEPEAAIAEYIDTLPAAFRGASFHWQLSSSAGHPTKSKDTLRAHVWFWLAKPVTSTALKAWAKSIQLPADDSLFQQVQIHYTAAPTFEAGVTDPVPRRSGFVQGERDAVEVEITPVERPKPEPRVERTVTRESSTPVSTSKMADKLRAFFTHYEAKHGKSAFVDEEGNRQTWLDALCVIAHHMGDDALALQVELSEPFWNAQGKSKESSCEEEIERRNIRGDHPTSPTMATFANKHGFIPIDDDAFGPTVTDEQHAADVAAHNAVAAAPDRDAKVRTFLANPRGGNLTLRHVEYSVDNFLARLTLIAGGPGIGKSTLITPLAAAVAHLVKYEGIKVTLPRTVLYFSEDPDQVERIIYGVRKHAPGAASVDEFRERFKVYEAQRWLPGSIEALIRIATEENMTDYRGYAVKPLIVFDTVNATFEIEDENSNDDWGRVLQPLKNALGSAGQCWLVHHLPKALEHITDTDKLAARGASALTGGVHTTAFVVNRPLLGSDVRVMGTKKVRFEHGGFDMLKFTTATEREEVPTPWGEPQVEHYRYGTPMRYSRRQLAAEEMLLDKRDDSEKGSEVENAILAQLAITTGLSGRELRDLVDGTNTDIDAARDRLVARGDVIKHPRKKKGGGDEYRLANEADRGKVRGNPDNVIPFPGAHEPEADDDSDLL